MQRHLESKGLGGNAGVMGIAITFWGSRLGADLDGADFHEFNKGYS